MAQHKVFLNLPVEDPARSLAFFTKLGLASDPRFTDEKAACLVFSEQAYAMLLRKDFFQTFTRKQLCDTNTHSEGLFALSCESRAAVDALVSAACAAGGQLAMDAQDHGFMYLRSFYDLDGHHWEAFWMDESSYSGQKP